MKNIITKIWQRIKCIRSIFNAIFFAHQWKTPVQLKAKLPEMKTTSITTGNEFYAGKFTLANHQIEINSQQLFLTKTKNENWLSELHTFSWLRHLQQTKISTLYANSLLIEWIELWGNAKKNLATWQLPIAAKRTAAWCTHAPQQNEIIIKSLIKHLRYLYAKIDFAFTPENKLYILLALTAGAICTAQNEKVQNEMKKKLNNELAKQIKNNFANFKPKHLLEITSQLIALQILCTEQKIDSGKNLQTAIDKMLSILSQLLHANGKIALFNGESSDTHYIKNIFSHFTEQKIETNKINYKRLQQNNSIVIANATKHNSLAFEFSSNNYLFIGGGDSNLTLDSQFIAAKNVSSKHKENELWLSHDGYKAKHGLLQKRILRISQNGNLIEGRDGFTPKQNIKQNLQWQLNFYIAGEIKSELTNNKIKLTALDGETWIFTAPNFLLSLQQSKITINSNLTKANEIYWRLERQI